MPFRLFLVCLAVCVCLSIYFFSSMHSTSSYSIIWRPDQQCALDLACHNTSPSYFLLLTRFSYSSFMHYYSWRLPGSQRVYKSLNEEEKRHRLAVNRNVDLARVDSHVLIMPLLFLLVSCVYHLNYIVDSSTRSTVHSWCSYFFFPIVAFYAVTLFFLSLWRTRFTKWRLGCLLAALSHISRSSIFSLFILRS